MKFKNILVITLLSASLLIGCSPNEENLDENPDNITNDGTVEENPDTRGDDQLGEDPIITDGDNGSNDPASGTIPAGADEAKQIEVENVSKIELFDLEGNLIKELSDKQLKEMVTAYNESMINDTMYIEMITGLQMVITMNNEETIRIHSYGSEENVVANGNDFSYHLIAPEIAKFLLSKDLTESN